MAYEVEFTPSFQDQFRALTARERVRAIAAIERQLSHQPLTETRNRKRLRPNAVAPWELRVGDLRVFYEVTDRHGGVVRILAIGRKRGNTVIIGGEEIQL